MSFTNRLKVDGTDVYTRCRMIPERDSYVSVMSAPHFKTLEITEWPDSDGCDVDLASPVLEPQSVTVKLVCLYEAWRSRFFSLIGGQNHSFEFTEVSKTLTMRMTDCSEVILNNGKSLMTLTFSVDNPTVTSASPYALGYTRVTQRGNLLDGIDISRYGCWLLDGSYEDYWKAAAIKENLVVSSKYVSGQTYYSNSHTSGSSTVYDTYKKPKDLRLNLLINARNLTEFHKCWNALFSKLVSSGKRTFQISGSSSALECYYKNSSISRFEKCPSGTIWCEFSLTLTLI